MRQLATIQKIITVEPILGADKIEVASLLGWKVVVKKGEFKAGDSCVYCEIDSLLPFADWSKFLWKPHDKPEDMYRLKTVKLRGQISQGLVLPMSVLDGKKFPTDKRENPVYPRTIGMNVTAMLGIQKYEPAIPAQLAGEVKGPFPCFIPKTDETRIQAAPGVLEEIRGCQVYTTMKLDGSSGTYYWNRGEFGVCSRNMEFKDGVDNTFTKMAAKYDIKDRMSALGRNLALQGEVCGEGIQKNRMGLKGHDLFIFNVYDIDAGRYLGSTEAMDIVAGLGMKFVPVLDTKVITSEYTVQTLLDMAKGNYPCTDNPREGIVVRPVMEMKSEVLKGRLSFKVINNDFLIANKE